ncbi:MAG TPA: hypothetical protein VIL74_14405 [Pyrinomonadaceae bacterium]|jgi:hypothetical protein
MKKLISSLLVFAVLFLSNVAAADAQSAKKIQFPKGRSSATVRGNTGKYGVYYELRLKGGQKMTLNLSPASKVGVKVERTGGAEVLLREERGGAYTLYFEEGGDVSIFVGSTGGKSVPFTLTVSVARMTDI